MALVKFTDGLEDIRGAFAGIVFTSGNTCHTVREHLIRVPQLSRLQVANQFRWGNLARAWIDTLTEPQRRGWRTYQNATTWRNRFGEPIRLSGLNCFLRVNDLRMTYGLPTRWTAPTLPGHAGEIAVTFTAHTLTQRIHVNEPTGDWDSATDNQVCYLAQGGPARCGNHEIPRRLRSLSAIQGNSFIPPAFPYQITPRWTLHPRQNVTIRLMHSDQFFRVGGPWYSSAITQP